MKFKFNQNSNNNRIPAAAAIKSLAGSAANTASVMFFPSCSPSLYLFLYVFMDSCPYCTCSGNHLTEHIFYLAADTILIKICEEQTLIR